MAAGRIASFFRSNEEGRNANKYTTSSSSVHAKHSELGKKKTAEDESHNENREKEYPVDENQTVSQRDLREKSRSLSIACDFEGKYPEIKTLGKESLEFNLKREKWILLEQVAEKDIKILELGAQIVELQMKHREEVGSLREEKKSVIRELCKTIAHHKDKLKFKQRRC